MKLTNLCENQIPLDNLTMCGFSAGIYYDITDKPDTISDQQLSQLINDTFPERCLQQLTKHNITMKGLRVSKQTKNHLNTSNKAYVSNVFNVTWNQYVEKFCRDMMPITKPSLSIV